MKTLKRKIAIMLSLCMVLSGTNPAYADEVKVPEAAAFDAITNEADEILEITEIIEEASPAEAEYGLATPSDAEHGTSEKRERDPEEIVPEKATPSNAKRQEKVLIREITVDGIKITLTADPGVFPEDAGLWAEKVEDEAEEAIEEAVKKERDSSVNVAASYKFDIKMLAGGEEIQPDTDKGSVKVTFTLEEKLGDLLTANAYHLREEADGELTAENLEAEVKTVEASFDETGGEIVLFDEDGSLSDGIIEADAELNAEVTEIEAEITSFSYYVVEFTYSELQYVLPGDSSVKLSVILEQLNLKGEVTAAEGSNDTLFTVTEDVEGGDWTVTALQAFTSKEWLKVTIYGIEYEIVVTDETDGQENWDKLQNALNGETAQPVDGLFEISGDTIKLLADFNADTGDTTLTVSGTKTLDLNGHVINADSVTTVGSVITVPSGANLTLTDSGSTEHYFTVGTDGLWTLTDTQTETTKTVTGGVITGGNTSEKGGGVNVSGTFNMNGGNIVGCKSTNACGGGVYVGGGTFAMSGGTIAGCTAFKTDETNNGQGGAIYMESNATVTLSGNAQIDSCVAGQWGGAISANAGSKSLTLSESCVIRDCRVNMNSDTNCGGGGVNVDCQFTMTGGTISGCSCGRGGGIRANSTNAVITGGTITGNIAANYGGGVLLESGKSLTLGGTAKITGNKKGTGKDEVTQNVYLPENKIITLGTGTAVPTEDMSIGVTLQSGTGVFTGENAKDYHALFAADAGEDYKVITLVNDSNKLKVIKKYTVAAAGIIEHGAISMTPTGGKVFEGETASFTVIPATGYQLKASSLKATYNDGSEKTCEIAQDAQDTAKYTFPMPAYDVTVTAEFEEKALTPVDVPTAATGLTYTGKELTGVAEATGYTVTNGKATKAGDYTATAALKAGYKWSDGTTAAKNIPWSIAKASVPAPLLKDSVTINYAAETVAPKTGYELSTQSGESFAEGKITEVTDIKFSSPYYIRKEEDANHFASAELTYTPVRPAAPSGFTVKEESIENKKNGTFSGITGAMEYQKNGNEWISGPAVLSGLSDETITVRLKATEEEFSGLVYSYTFTASTEKLTVIMGDAVDHVPYNGLVTRPADPEKEGYTFGGWYRDETCTDAWNFALDTVNDDMTLYPKWIKNEEKKASIGGNVTEDGAAVPGAVVELFLGKDKVAATVTDANGSYKFDSVELGTYNIVVTKTEDDSTKTKTALVTVNKTGGFSVDVKLPKGDVNSVVEHKEGDIVPDAKSDISQTVVGGLDEIAEEQAPAGGDRIIIKLTVEPKKDEHTEAQQKIKKEAGEGKKVEFIDLSLLKQVNDGEEENIGGSNKKLLTIVIPFNFEGVNVTGMMILRNHGGSTSKLTRTSNSDGEYFAVNRSAGTLTIYAKKFSDYAIAYTEIVNPPEEKEDSGSDYITAYAEPVTKATAISGRWVYKEAEDTWYYTVNGSNLKNGWYYLANPYSKTEKTGWFCFDEAGRMRRGWILSRLGHWFFCHDIKDGDLGRLETGWHDDRQDGLRYYLDPETGRMYTGWHTINGIRYFFTENSQASDWRKDEKGRWTGTNASEKPLGSLDPKAEK